MGKLLSGGMDSILFIGLILYLKEKVTRIKNLVYYSFVMIITFKLTEKSFHYHFFKTKREKKYWFFFLAQMFNTKNNTDRKKTEIKKAEEKKRKSKKKNKEKITGSIKPDQPTPIEIETTNYSVPG